jgi:soluble lytic murein transglycosylase
MRRSVGWAAPLALAAACATTPPWPREELARPPVEPLGAGFAALAAERWGEAARLLAEAGRRYPALEDYTLYFRARAARRAGRTGEALETVTRLLAAPDSVWAPRGLLLAGELRWRAGDVAGARAWLGAARTVLPPGRTGWKRATLALAEVELAAGEPLAALELATAVRCAEPRSVAARRGRRLSARVRAAHPALALPAPVDEAEMRLREGDRVGARAAAAEALASGLPAPLQARALWVLAQAARALGDLAAAERACLTLGRDLASEALAPRALVAAAGWRWNADDDAGALELFREAAERFPDDPQSAEALYGMGRIDQEAGRYHEAFVAYRDLAARFPAARMADEARWRMGWVRYLAGEFAAAEERFRALADDAAGAVQVAAEYWRGRALEQLGRRAEARMRFARLAERHPSSYYTGLVDARLGRQEPEAPPPPEPPPPFPPELEGPHAERARLLLDLGFRRFARVEVVALRAAGAPVRPLLDAYQAIGAPGRAIRLAREVGGDPEALGRYLYPLGYWDLVYPEARARGLDPLLVVALIRQESLFDPDAVSSADARGLMQLLPATARELTGPGGAAPSLESLHRADTNVGLGVTLLARLLERHGGSLPRALAAYNAGEEALAKWDRRYAGRDPDEFVELISYRETRDYVKRVLGNYRAYRRLYASSASLTSPGSPPKAPFDMTTMTSPGRAEATR